MQVGVSGANTGVVTAGQGSPSSGSNNLLGGGGSFSKSFERAASAFMHEPGESGNNGEPIHDWAAYIKLMDAKNKIDM